MSIVQYLKDTRGELKHVSWPTQKQTAIFTALVIGISLLTAAYLGALDYVFSQALNRAVTQDETITTPDISVTPVGVDASSEVTIEEVPLEETAE